MSGGVDAPVWRYEFETGDPELASHRLREIYTVRPPRLSGERERFGMTMSGAGAADSGWRIDEIQHSMALNTETDTLAELYVMHVAAGRYAMSYGEHTIQIGPGEMLLLDPVRMQHGGWDAGIDLQTVCLTLDPVRRLAEQFTELPADQIEFGFSTPVTPAATRYWTRTVAYAAGLLAQDEPLSYPLLRAETSRMLATAMIHSFPNTALDILADPHTPYPVAVVPVVLRRAVEFIDANAHRPITLGDISEAARVGARALQQSFRRHYDTTPLGYVRRVRLEHAHRELVEADPTNGATVAATARRWGFADPARFSTVYRAAYGCRPSRTLRS